MLSYINGKYLPKEEITISPDDRGFLFADGLYEVIRSYDGRLFQFQEHMARLNYGARQLRFNVTEFDSLLDVAENLIDQNGLKEGDALIYIQVTRGVAPRLHKFPPAETPLTVYATPRPFTPRRDELENGIGVLFVPDVRWARCDIKQVGLLPNVLAHQRAVESGAAEAVFVRDGAITEGTHSNIFAVISGQVITPPRTNYILGGITRRVVLRLCKELNFPFAERALFEHEARRADELFIAGTTVEITPVVKVDDQEVGSGRPGILTRRLQEAFEKFKGKQR